MTLFISVYFSKYNLLLPADKGFMSVKSGMVLYLKTRDMRMTILQFTNDERQNSYSSQQPTMQNATFMLLLNLVHHRGNLN